MATSLHQVRRNFAYQLEQIAPTNTNIERRFLALDRMRMIAAGNTTGQARDFTIQRMRADEDQEPTDMSLREAWHEFELRIHYPKAIGLELDLGDIMDQDRHQICERLRNGTYYVGIASDSTLAIGLLNRVRLFDELDEDNDDNGDVWVQIHRWRCLVRELA